MNYFDRFAPDNPLEQIQEWLGRITYRPNVVLTAYRFEPGEINGMTLRSPVNCTNIRITAKVEDTYNHGKEIQTVSVFPYPDAALDFGFDHFVAWVRRSLHDWEMHESDEWLLVDGGRKFDPHK